MKIVEILVVKEVQTLFMCTHSLYKHKELIVDENGEFKIKETLESLGYNVNSIMEVGNFHDAKCTIGDKLVAVRCTTASAIESNGKYFLLTNIETDTKNIEKLFK